MFLTDSTAAEDVFEQRQLAAKAAGGQLKLSWPEDTHLAILEIQVAKLLINSDLLVQEDQDFVNNFVDGHGRESEDQQHPTKQNRNISEILSND